ncbi:MAG TPA: hypothetical protein VFN53_06395 [Acidobacteriaceae bacterium]|nr:hypothetical protein [Acidobacteriaceae bacterium]
MSRGVQGLGLMVAGAAIDVGAVMAAPFTGGASLYLLTIGTTLMISGAEMIVSGPPTTPQTVKSPVAPWQIVYGNVRCGGTIIDCNSYGSDGNDFKYADMVVVLAAHPCVGVQQHTETINGTTPFPSYGGLYINGQGMQWRNNAEGGSTPPGTYTEDFGATPFGFTTSNDLQDLNQNHYRTGGHVYMETYNGTGQSYQGGSLVQNQVSQYYVTKGPSGHWDDTCTLMYDLGTTPQSGGTTANPIYLNEQGVPKGFTYVYIRLLYAASLWSGGLPNSLRFDLQGKNDIWDPRLNSGAGGYAFTTNAALIIADFMTNPYWGMGYKMADIDQTQLIAAANICDIAIDQAEGGQIPQYTINGSFTTAVSPAETLKAMLTCCAGSLVEINGLWNIFPGAYVFPTATITPAMMNTPIHVKTGQKGRDLINAVKGKFVCPAAVDTIGSPNVFLNEQPNIYNGQWQSQPFPAYAMDPQHGYSSDIWLARDGQKLYQDLSLPFVTNSNTAQRLAKIALLRNRMGNGLDDNYNQGATISLTCSLAAYDIVAHDTVWISYPRFGWTAPPAGATTYDPATQAYTEFEVLSSTFTVDESSGAPVPGIHLILKPVSPDIYTWNASDQVPLQGNKYPQFANTMQVGAPSNFVIQSGSATSLVGNDGSVKSTILCTWTPPSDAYVSNGGQIVLQLMPYVAAANTYTCLANQDNLTIGGTSNPFGVGDQVLLAGAATGGGMLSSTVYAVSGQTIYVTRAPRNAVTAGNIQMAAWDTIANLYGGTTKYSISNVSDGSQYFVQIFAQNSAGIVSDYIIAGPLLVSNGLERYANGNVIYPPGSTLANMQAGSTGNVLLFNANFDCGSSGWAAQAGWTVNQVVANPLSGANGFIGYFSGTATSEMANSQLIPVTPGDVLTVTNKMKASDSGCTGSLTLGIIWLDSTGTALSVTSSGAAAIADWTQYRVVGTAPAGAVSAQVRVAITAPTTTDWWGVAAFTASLHLNSLDELPDGNIFRRVGYVDKENFLSASTALVPQGSVMPVNPFNVGFTSSTDSSNVSTIDCSWNADTLLFPNYQNVPAPPNGQLSVPAGSVSVGSLAGSTTYYCYFRCAVATGALTLYTPLPTAASPAAAQWQNLDGYVPFQPFSVATPVAPSSGTSSGTGSGGGTNTCPDADELVCERDMGIMRIGDVAAGYWLKGIVYDADGRQAGTEYRRVTAKRERYSEVWRTVEGRKVSPHHPVRYMGNAAWGDRWLTPHEIGPLDTSAGVRVQVALDTDDYQQANYILYDAAGNPSLVMHNAFLIS